jgi:hypothetical protein
MMMYDDKYDVMMSMSEHLKNNDMMITTIDQSMKKKNV